MRLRSCESIGPGGSKASKAPAAVSTAKCLRKVSCKGAKAVSVGIQGWLSLQWQQQQEPKQHEMMMMMMMMVEDEEEEDGEGEEEEREEPLSSQNWR